METTVHSTAPSPLYSSSGKFLGAAIAGLLPIPRLLPPFQRYPSQAIVFDEINRSRSRLRSLATTLAASTTVPSNGSTAQTPDVAGYHPSSNASAINPFGLKALEGGFDVTELPVEIVCEIFEKFIEDDLQPKDPKNDDPAGPLVARSCRSDPTILGQICSRWRAVAIDLPTLWSNIYIYNPKRSQVRLVDIWLGRSANKPLTLAFDYNWSDEACDLKAASNILRSFASHLERWRIIDFHIPLQLLGTLSRIAHIPKTPVLLESCYLGFNTSLRYLYKPHFGPLIDAIWRVIHASPNLHRVKWGSTGLDKVPNHAPFHQLTHVETYLDFSIDAALALLAAVPLIQELSLSTITSPSEIAPESGTQLLLLQHLRILIINSRSTPACSIFSSITCPSLQRLEINHRSLAGEAPQSMSELVHLLQRSNCQLQHLDIRDRYLSDDELALLLPCSALYSLAHLLVSKNQISDQVIQLLMKKSDDGSHQVAPRLEKLVLDFCETTDGLLSKVIYSRWHDTATSSGTLRCAHIWPRNGYGPIDKDFFDTHTLR
ncbi:hypothetical protein M413DRAFT_447179 [Hebeloma cylindrosporum]|uniref:Uncharacterized protein n=1 Tax=Hebeloma cylindrosporum TaxID=76867 RepID=A0A0C2XNJ1_HEBCY|nr:hypothetical protein M413DRAFT_447179 [Hebeloma cylindrosporum h7]